MAKDNIVLVIGATGGVGSETALAFSRRGFRIRALHRRPQEAASNFAHLNYDWVKGDAMNAAEITNAAEGTRFIVHGANPPMYRNWPKLVGSRWRKPYAPSLPIRTCRSGPCLGGLSGRIAFCAADARVVGDALSLASADATRQYQARIDPRERAAYSGRGGSAGIADRARLSVRQIAPAAPLAGTVTGRTFDHGEMIAQRP
jgi:NAD(P)-dependent dehydrogenase (short-subunit alcohol dehydrogenase family)